MDKTVEELKKVILYRETQLKALGRAVPPVPTESCHVVYHPVSFSGQLDMDNSDGWLCVFQILAVGLTSRRNLCVHDAVSQFDNKVRLRLLLFGLW
jgi:hypothetical protein